MSRLVLHVTILHSVINICWPKFWFDTVGYLWHFCNFTIVSYFTVQIELRSLIRCLMASYIVTTCPAMKFSSLRLIRVNIVMTTSLSLPYVAIFIISHLELLKKTNICMPLSQCFSYPVLSHSQLALLTDAPTSSQPRYHYPSWSELCESKHSAIH